MTKSEIQSLRRRTVALATRRRTSLERRASSYGPVPINDSHTLFGNYPLTSTGIRVDNYSADCNIVFRRCCEIIAESAGKMSPGWEVLDATKEVVTGLPELPLITQAANDYTSAYNFWCLVIDWAESWGNGYAWILRRNDLTPIGLYPLHPSRVSPRVVRGQTPDRPWRLVYQIDGGRETFLPYEILHIKGNPGFDGVTGYNIVMLHENALAIAQAQEEFAGEFYANQATAGGLIELPAHMKPDVVKKYQTDFQNQYSSRGNRHKMAVVDSGVKFTATTISPENSQLLESRRFSIEEIALMKGVPLTMLGQLNAGTYANTEQQQLAFNTIKMHPVSENCRQELNLKLTPDGTHSWRYDLKILDAADTETRQNYLHTAVGGPWMSKEEARERDGLPKDIAGTIYPPPNMNSQPDAPDDSQADDNQAGEQGQPAGANRSRPQKKTERRFNENHDEATGQFTSADGGSDSEKYPHLAHVLNGAKVHSSGHSKADAKALVQKMREEGTYASAIKDPKGARGKQYLITVPKEGRFSNFRRNVERRSLDTRNQAAAAMLPVMQDAAVRMAKKEARAIGGYVTKHLREGQTGAFLDKTNAFYAEHEKHVGEAFAPALSSLNTQVRQAVKMETRADGDYQLSDDTAVGAYAEKMAGRHVEHQKQTIAAILTGEQDVHAAADKLDAHLKQWQDTRAAGDADYELRQAHNYFAREAYRAAGSTHVRWAASPGCECIALDLDGKEVAIDEPFTAEPKRFHPPFNSECRCGLCGGKKD